MDCVFCKIIKGEIPCYKIYEDEYTLAFLDISKDVDGHTLVIPKKHVVNILDCDAETLQHVLNIVKKVAKHYIDIGYSGINLLNANGKTAGQSVFHLHFHIFPRKESDNANLWPHNASALHSLEEMANKLKLN